MNIQISNEAVSWYQEELSFTNGDFIRFFVRYGGSGNLQSGFSLGISNEEPIDIGAKIEKDGITFYIEEKDLWYFDEHDLIIELKPEFNEPVFQYEKR